MKCELCGRQTLEDSMGILTIKLEELDTVTKIGDKLILAVCYDCIPTLVDQLKNGIIKAAEEKRKTDNLKMELKAMGQALAETPTSFYSEERTEELLMKVAATVYEEWLIWTYGATDMSSLLKMDVKPLPVSKTAEFKDLLNSEKAPFILAAGRIIEAIEGWDS